MKKKRLVDKRPSVLKDKLKSSRHEGELISEEQKSRQIRGVTFTSQRNNDLQQSDLVRDVGIIPRKSQNTTNGDEPFQMERRNSMISGMQTIIEKEQERTMPYEVA